MPSFLGGMKTHCYIVMSTNNSGVDNVTFSREGLTEVERERKQSGARITSNTKRLRKRAGTVRSRERRQNGTFSGPILQEDNALELVNQSTRCTGYKHKPSNKYV